MTAAASLAVEARSRPHGHKMIQSQSASTSAWFAAANDGGAPPPSLSHRHIECHFTNVESARHLPCQLPRMDQIDGKRVIWQRRDHGATAFVDRMHHATPRPYTASKLTNSKPFRPVYKAWGEG